MLSSSIHGILRSPVAASKENVSSFDNESFEASILTKRYLCNSKEGQNARAVEHMRVLALGIEKLRRKNLELELANEQLRKQKIAKSQEVPKTISRIKPPSFDDDESISLSSTVSHHSKSSLLALVDRRTENESANTHQNINQITNSNIIREQEQEQSVAQLNKSIGQSQSPVELPKPLERKSETESAETHQNFNQLKSSETSREQEQKQEQCVDKLKECTGQSQSPAELQEIQGESNCKYHVDLPVGEQSAENIAEQLQYFQRMYQQCVGALEQANVKNKDLEVKIADKNLFISELSKELDNSKDEKNRLTNAHEKEIANLCINRIAEVERRVRMESEEKICAKYESEIIELKDKLEEMTETTKDLRLQIIDENFQKAEANRQLKELSQAHQKLVDERELEGETKRQEWKIALSAVRHDVEQEVNQRMKSHIEALENQLEQKNSTIRDLKMRQYDEPDEVISLRRDLISARVQIAAMRRAGDSVYSLSEDCVNNLVTHLHDIRTALCFTNRLEDMTISAIQAANNRARAAVDKIEEILTDGAEGSVSSMASVGSLGSSKSGAPDSCTKSNVDSPIACKTKTPASSGLIEKSGPLRQITVENENASLNTLSKEWAIYYENKRKEEESKLTLVEREAQHFVASLKRNTFFCGGCFDLS